MTDDRRTRADLLAALALAEERLTNATEREQRRDLEARAFDDCTRILEHLEQLSRPQRAAGGNFASAQVWDGGPARVALPPTTPVGRVLDYLRVRFGLPDGLVEVQRLAAQLREVETERDELRTRLSRVTNAAAGANGVWT